MSHILSRQGADPKVSGHFFKDLNSFQHRVARWITGRQTRRRGYGSWYYNLLTASMEEAGFKEIGTYVTRRQNKVAQYIATRLILDLCERSAWRPGSWLSWRW